MANQSYRPLFILALSLALLSLTAASRHPSPRSTTPTATLDVAKTLALANAAVSAAKTLDQDLTAATSSAGGNGVILSLHSRDFFANSGGRHEDYASLTAARLRRDAARVSAIEARVSGKLATSEEEIRGVVVSGASQGSGEYFSRIGVGTPAKKMYVVLDTGSDVTWIQCRPCNECYQQSDALFDPSLSDSYSQLPCSSARCRALDVSACKNTTSSSSAGFADGLSVGKCMYQVSYGDGSYTVGDFATETMTLGGSELANVAFGCGHDNEGLFVGAAGLLALGAGRLSFPSQIAARSFSYCLVDRDSPSSSTLELTTTVAEAIELQSVTAPLLRNSKLSTFYYVLLTGISVGGQLLDIPSSTFSVSEGGAGGVIVDSGTAVSRLPAEAYAALREAFKRGTGALPTAAGVSLFDTCYDLSAVTSVEVPTVSLHFPQGRELQLPAKNYLIPVNGKGTYCLAFAATSAALSIIGNVQQQGMRVTFDLYNSVVGFSPKKC